MIDSQCVEKCDPDWLDCVEFELGVWSSAAVNMLYRSKWKWSDFWNRMPLIFCAQSMSLSSLFFNRNIFSYFGYYGQAGIESRNYKRFWYPGINADIWDGVVVGSIGRLGMADVCDDLTKFAVREDFDFLLLKSFCFNSRQSRREPRNRLPLGLCGICTL